MRLGEIFALLRTATNLLSTYVGRDAGERILAGQIQLGDTDTLKAVIWFSDLRGFTELTRSNLPAALIRALNELFGCQIPSIEKRGGEVLKFIGDGLLAIFLTCIGQAVNLAARLESLAARLGRPVVLSEPFAALTSRGRSSSSAASSSRGSMLRRRRSLPAAPAKFCPRPEAPRRLPIDRVFR